MIPKLPSEYKGKEMKKSMYDKYTPRRWTKEEEQWVLDLFEKGHSYSDIAESVDREEVSVSIKIKRLKKKTNTYNEKHYERKYEQNQLFLDEINPKSILDVYCGVGSYYKDKADRVVTNDIEETIEADYHMDSFKLLCYLNYKDEKFDLIDLDPFGSAFNCIDLSLKMAKKGLIITLGEMGHKRFKRLDFVERMYDIHTLEDFNAENIAKAIQKIGLQNKKELEVFNISNYKNISRIYFKIKDLEITKQWTKKEGI